MVKSSVSTILPLDAAQIHAQLSPELQQVIPVIQVFAQLASTNEWLLHQTDACGQICLAEQQTAGRGRRGRFWQSPNTGNIYFSLRWCFEQVPVHYSWLSLVVGVAVAEALADYGLTGHGLKWPNDIHVEGRKLGGILLQTAQPLQQVVIGVGLNTRLPSMSAQAQLIEQPWCDLSQLLGEAIDRNRLLALLLSRLLPALQAFPNFKPTAFKTQWQDWDVLYHQWVEIHTATERLQGCACGLDEQGQLLIEVAGEYRSFAAADVSVRPNRSVV